MAHAGNAKIEEMDDGEATSIDMPEIVGGDLWFPIAYSDDTEKKAELIIMEEIREIRQNLEKAMVPLRRPSGCTIFRIPEFVFNENSAAYVPHTVSIGPFHHEQQHLQRMEARKMKYLDDFLRRSSSPEKLEDYVKAITYLVERANKCYAEAKPHDRKSLVMMMVLDGCFILELLLREPDTMSDEKWIFLVLLDLILLENQLPFIVLEALYEVFNEDSGHEVADTLNLTSLMCKNFVPHILRFLLGDVEMNSPEDIELTEPKHLLDLVLQFLKPQSRWQLTEKRIEETSVSIARNCLRFAPECVRKLCQGDPLEEDNLIVRIRCATELEKAGVKFKKNKKPKSLLDIEFDSANGVLTIPGISIHHSTQSILRNLVAYEQCTDDYNYVTEYAAFLDGLIDSPNDLKVLQKSGIIETILDDPSEIAGFFHSLLKDSAVSLYYTVHVPREIEQYCNIPWLHAWHKWKARINEWKASLMLNYFNTPWSLISVIAATILLVLTFMQTYYSAKPYIS